METRAAARQRLLLQIGPNPEVTREIGIIDIKKKPTPVAKRKVIPPPQPAANIQNAAHQQPRKRPRKKSRTSKKKRATTARKNTKTPTTPRVELNGPPVEHVEQPNIDDNNVALLAFLALPELEEEVDIKPPAIIKQEIERQPQIACPRCTAFNDDTLDDCVVCEAPLKCSDDGQLLAEIERIQDNCGIACNSRTIECPVCFATVPPGDGCVLHECLHEFCAECLRLAVQHSPQADVKCPYTCAEFSCASSLLAKEIRALLSGEQYEAYLCRSLGEAERQTQQEAFHCKSVDCAYWCLVDVGGWIFYCPVCQRKNCTACKAIHEAEQTCQEYQQEQKMQREENDIQHLMNENPDVMKCPSCQTMITKESGCDYVVCKSCATAICWATRGPRWGPLGKGDTTAGCRCRLVADQLCHPDCRNCH